MNKALEALEEMRNEAVSDLCRFIPKEESEAHKEVAEYFDKRKSIIEKELQALEIIKDKRVCIELLLDISSLQEYNDICIFHKSHSNSSYKCLTLTQEEFDLLKEVLL